MGKEEITMGKKGRERTTLAGKTIARLRKKRESKKKRKKKEKSDRRR